MRRVFAFLRFAMALAARGTEGRREPQDTTRGFDPKEEHLLPNGER
jgi:hypothetical protein